MIKIKCVVKNSTYKYNFIVKVYNNDNRVIGEYKINNNEAIHIDIDVNMGYKILAIGNSDLLYSPMVKRVISDYLLFEFERLYICSSKITFNLKDYWYDNMPIQRGVIYLWPNRIQYK